MKKDGKDERGQGQAAACFAAGARQGVARSARGRAPDVWLSRPPNGYGLGSQAERSAGGCF